MIVPAPKLGPNPKGARYLSQVELYELLARLTTEELYTDLDLNDAIECTLVLSNGEHVSSIEFVPQRGGPRVMSTHPKHELRLASMPWSEGAFVGKIPESTMIVRFRHSYDEALKAFQREQPGCEWKLIAARIEQRNLRQTHETVYSGPVYNDFNAGAAPGFQKGEAIPYDRKVDHIEVPDYRAYVHLVFCDIGEGGQLQDPHAAHADGEVRKGPMSVYATTKNIGDLGAGQREMRRECEALVREFMAQQADAELEPEPEPEPPKPVPVVPQPKAKSTKPKEPRSQGPSALVATEIIDPEPERTAQIVSMRQKGFTLVQIAQAMSVDEAVVAEALRVGAS